MRENRLTDYRLVKKSKVTADATPATPTPTAPAPTPTAAVEQPAPESTTPGPAQEDGSTPAVPSSATDEAPSAGGGILIFVCLGAMALAFGALLLGVVVVVLLKSKKAAPPA